MPGRRPKPTELKRLEGSRIRRKGTEPQPTGIPKCPAHLDKIARTEWRRIAAELAAIGLLTSVDRAALAAYCAAWSRWVVAETKLAKFGSVIKSPKSGFPIQNPYVGIANTAMTQMRAFIVEFGMTPASRSRINIESPTQSADPFSEFMASIGAEDMTGSNESEDTELQSASD
jgi:P27 family predicted phage terminase small subunit